MASIRIFVDGIEYEPNAEEAKAVAIEKWYDRHERSWVLYPVDTEGNQLASAIYVYSKTEANAIQKDLAAEYGL